MNTDQVMDWMAAHAVGETVTVRQAAEAFGLPADARLDVVRKGLGKAVKWGYAVKVYVGTTVCYIRCERYADPEGYEADRSTKIDDAYRMVQAMAYGQETTSAGLYTQMDRSGRRLNITCIRTVLKTCTADGILVRRRSTVSPEYIYTRTTKAVRA